MQALAVAALHFIHAMHTGEASQLPLFPSSAASPPSQRAPLPPLSFERLCGLVAAPSTSDVAPLSVSVLRHYAELVRGLLQGVDVDSLSGSASAASVLASHPLLVAACRPSFLSYAAKVPRRHHWRSAQQPPSPSKLGSSHLPCCAAPLLPGSSPWTPPRWCSPWTCSTRPCA